MNKALRTSISIASVIGLLLVASHAPAAEKKDDDKKKPDCKKDPDADGCTKEVVIILGREPVIPGAEGSGRGNGAGAGNQGDRKPPKVPGGGKESPKTCDGEAKEERDSATDDYLDCVNEHKEVAENICNARHQDYQVDTGQTEYVCDADWQYCIDNRNKRGTHRYITTCCDYQLFPLSCNGEKYTYSNHSQYCGYISIMEEVDQTDERAACVSRMQNGGQFTTGTSEGRTQGTRQGSNHGNRTVYNETSEEMSSQTSGSSRSKTVVIHGFEQMCATIRDERLEDAERKRQSCGEKENEGKKEEESKEGSSK